MLVLAGPKAAFADPIFWLDQCLEAAADEPKPEFAEAYCGDDVLQFCRFGDNSLGCFSSLSRGMNERNLSILDALPENIGPADEDEQIIYARTLEGYRSKKGIFECEPNFPEGACAARDATFRFWQLQVLTKQVELIEAQK